MEAIKEIGNTGIGSDAILTSVLNDLLNHFISRGCVACMRYTMGWWLAGIVWKRLTLCYSVLFCVWTVDHRTQELFKASGVPNMDERWGGSASQSNNRHSICISYELDQAVPHRSRLDCITQDLSLLSWSSRARTTVFCWSLSSWEMPKHAKATFSYLLLLIIHPGRPRGFNCVCVWECVECYLWQIVCEVLQCFFLFQTK